MYTQQEINLIILSSFAELSYSVKRNILSDFRNATPYFLKHENFLIKTLGSGVYNKVKANFSDPNYRSGILDGLKNRGIVCVSYFSDCYPECLKFIDDPPVLLYCKGDISLLKTDCFAVVGSRRSTAKALADCEKICAGLAEKFTVVSGMAEGADSAALKGALDSGKKVISVLANGLDRIYPASNAHLAQRIEKQGLLISEYPPETLPQRYFFPFRNRIIAGLSKGVLVVSAAQKSGALITADYAAEYGREVFSFPYSIGNKSGEGCNSLIKKGAALADNILDIFGKFDLDFTKPQPQRLTDEEFAVYKQIQNCEEVFLPRLAADLNLTIQQANFIMMSLEIKQYVVRTGGNKYSALI